MSAYRGKKESKDRRPCRHIEERERESKQRRACRHIEGGKRVKTGERVGI